MYVKDFILIMLMINCQMFMRSIGIIYKKIKRKLLKLIGFVRIMKSIIKHFIELQKAYVKIML